MNRRHCIVALLGLMIAAISCGKSAKKQPPKFTCETMLQRIGKCTPSGAKLDEKGFLQACTKLDEIREFEKTLRCRTHKDCFGCFECMERRLFKWLEPEPSLSEKARLEEGVRHCDKIVIPAAKLWVAVGQPVPKALANKAKRCPAARARLAEHRAGELLKQTERDVAEALKEASVRLPARCRTAPKKMQSWLKAYGTKTLATRAEELKVVCLGLATTTLKRILKYKKVKKYQSAVVTCTHFLKDVDYFDQRTARLSQILCDNMQVLWISASGLRECDTVIKTGDVSRLPYQCLDEKNDLRLARSGVALAARKKLYDQCFSVIGKRILRDRLNKTPPVCGFTARRLLVAATRAKYPEKEFLGLLKKLAIHCK